MNQKQPNIRLLMICGLVGLFGCVSVVVTDFIGIAAVDGYNPISQTISALAITEKAWIQDTGLNLFAASLAACAVGLLSMSLGSWKWKVGASMLLILAIDVLLISEHDKYAGREGVGASIHIYCVYALGILFTLAPALLSSGLQKVSRGWQRFSLWTAICWAALSPVFFFVPNGWDGAYERFISLFMITWVALISWLLVQKGFGKRSITPFRGEGTV
ncbi:MAG: DUF998 domain-containing protein [Phormidesmis sp.]